MKERARVLAGLEHTPALLRELISEVPAMRLKERRIPGKWTIHEHAVHMGRVHEVLSERLIRFMKEDAPEFVPYFPAETVDPDEMLWVDLSAALKTFAKERRVFVALLRKLRPHDWRKRAKHPEYDLYTPYIMARHVLLHDQVHMYRIEELWLTKDPKKK